MAATAAPVRVRKSRLVHDELTRVSSTLLVWSPSILHAAARRQDTGPPAPILAGPQPKSVRRGPHRLLAVIVRKQPFQLCDLREIVVEDIGMIRVANQEILVVGLRRIEALQRIHPGRDPAP